MEFTGSVAASFSASHIVKGHSRCGRLHGHRWRVQVTIKAGQDPETGDLVGLPELAAAVERICAEVDREHVNDMFPASQPTPAGIALAVRERLAMDFRTIQSVTVWADDAESTLYV